ncbi:alkaline phosphatase [cf. Phormidesmis sp. LEGE 11477]|uniref:alkaline phosphatase n=1 Tax=cf. Phormidesmis sp. LEGE 11477 TaxID=1828680 RepID=UPI001881D934|nr:alkaline phosphatase [cf. Phormidesmis sp. LEGE 11477]MBE9061313.1 alkaline phosphatase [cf. Phormidesmis sp. LEGE 11477]
MSNHVIFIHPDGTSPAHFGMARFVKAGPDGRLNWDQLDEAAVYLGHMEDQLTGTSNGGAVTHATGVKVYAESFGFEVVRDEDGNPVIDEATGRAVEEELIALSGTNQTIMQEAVAAGKATALINSGVIAEPGTAAFAAEVGQADVPADAEGFSAFPRGQFADITRQVVESGIDVILGGGLVNYLPVGTEPPAGAVYASSAQQLDAISTGSNIRPDTNLIELAESLGYTVVYTKAELDAVASDLSVTKVLGIFANEDTFNDTIRTLGGGRTPDGGLPGFDENLVNTDTPPYVPSAPTVGEMLAAGQVVLERSPKFAEGSLVVLEEEGTDNFGNINSASGMLEGLLRTDEAVGVALDFYERHPNTLIITAADSDAGGLQTDDTGETAGTTSTNPTGIDSPDFPTFQNPNDGQQGVGTAAFVAQPSESGNVYNFDVAWAGRPDFAGAIVTKAHGLNADRLPQTVDNTDIYRAMYETLFEVELPDRPVPEFVPAPAATEDTGNVIFIHPDGTSPSMYGFARFESVGPDGRLNYDLMSDSGVYLGHMRDQLVGTSNAGAVTHATGVKAQSGSFGLDEFGDPVVSRSGKRGVTILEEAIAAGKSTAVINSGFIAEPGTGAFLAEVESRGNVTSITEQIIDSGVNVILGGGEIHYLPVGTMGRFGEEGVREDGRNLIAEAEAAGFTVVFDLEELQDISEGTEQLLGIFAAEDTYNDNPEELNQSLGLDNYGQLLPDGTPTNQPTVAQMLEAALPILSADPDGFMVVMEEEGTDNLGNDNNSGGVLEATLRADAALGVAMDFIQAEDPNTLLITAADSEAGGVQVWQPTPFGPALPETIPEGVTLPTNPTDTETFENPADGAEGRVPPLTTFASQPSLDGEMGNFVTAWAGTSDFAGSVVAKTYGMNADLLNPTVDNTEIYQIMYQTLFGVDSLPDYQDGTNEADQLVGGDDSDVVVGFGGDDLIAGGLGDDILYGSDGDDRIRGDANRRSAQIGESGGDDILYGGDGNDIMGGKGGNDSLFGEIGDDTLYGDRGDDILYGGLGSDRLFGDDKRSSGADVFVLAAGEGSDRIMDFEVGKDTIGLAGTLSFGQLSIVQSGANAMIELGEETLAIVRNTSADLLTESAFMSIDL